MGEEGEGTGAGRQQRRSLVQEFKGRGHRIERRFMAASCTTTSGGLRSGPDSKLTPASVTPVSGTTRAVGGQLGTVARCAAQARLAAIAAHALAMCVALQRAQTELVHEHGVTNRCPQSNRPGISSPT